MKTINSDGFLWNIITRVACRLVQARIFYILSSKSRPAYSHSHSIHIGYNSKCTKQYMQSHKFNVHKLNWRFFIIILSLFRDVYTKATETFQILRSAKVQIYKSQGGQMTLLHSLRVATTPWRTLTLNRPEKCAKTHSIFEDQLP